MEWVVHGERRLYANRWVNLDQVDVELPDGERFWHHVVRMQRVVAVLVLDDAGEKVLLIDDLIATGGTAEGAVKLLHKLGAEVIAACFVIDLPELGGAKKIEALGVPVHSLIAFAGH